MLGCAHHASPWLDNPGLLSRDFLDRMTEIIFVIEINLRDDGDFGEQDVGRIEPPAHARLAHGKLDARRCKMHEGDRCYALEKRGMRGEAARSEKLFNRAVNARERPGKLLVRNVYAVHANALVDSLEVGRSI